MASRARRMPGEAPPSLSLRDRAYAEIKRRINRLEFRPGLYLNEATISEELGIGRTPVHQALDRLMREGLVQVIPRKGVIVQPVSLDEVLQIADVRLVNETHGVSLAVERATAADISNLRRILQGAPTLIRSRDLEGLMNLDRRFHSRIAQMTRNPVLADILSSLHERSLRFWFISLSDDLHLRRVHEEHRCILEAIADRDRAAAGEAMRAHIESFRKNIVRTI